MLNSAHLYTAPDRTVQPGSLQYWLLVVPICAFVAIVGASLLRATLRREVWWLALFAVLVCATAIVKGDPRIAISFLLLISTITVILEGRLTVNVTFLNILFLASVLWAVITTALGVNQYGVVPVADSTFLGVGWRVSLFPY